MVHGQLDRVVARHLLHRSYSRSGDPATVQLIVDDNLNRQYFTLPAQAVGPVFTRVWDTPDNGYAERFKHSIEPFFNVQRTLAIDDFDRIVQTDGVDYDRRQHDELHLRPEQPLLREAAGRERSARRRRSSTSSFRRPTTPTRGRRSTIRSTPAAIGRPSNFSPLASPSAPRRTPTFNATFRAEFDSRNSASCGRLARRPATTGRRVCSPRRLEPAVLHRGLAGFDDPDSLDHYLNVDDRATRATTASAASTRSTTTSCSRAMLQQRITGFYNAQCCGIAFEYQRYNYSAAVVRPGRPSLLPVVHAGRSRQLLAVQRRDRQQFRDSALALPTLVTGAAGFAGGHLLELLAARAAGTARRVARPSGTRSAAGDAWRRAAGRQRRLGGGRSARSDSASRARSAGPAVESCITAPAPRTSGGRGNRPSRHSRSTCAARITCSRGCAPRLHGDPRARPELGDRLRAVRRAAHRRPSARCRRARTR